MEPTKNFNDILCSFNINATCINYQCIDNYTFFDLQLGAKAKVKDIEKYADEISLALKSATKPVIKIIHDLGVVRMEFISPRSTPLNLFDYISDSDLPKGDLVCLLGQTIEGKEMWMDIAANPHMIVAGTTGSGKSTLLHNIIANLLRNTTASLYLIDPKSIEFVGYDKSLKDRIKVSYSYEDSVKILDSMIITMESRYNLMKAGVPASVFPWRVLVIDEFADMIMQDKNNQFYDKLCRLAQKSRAARIHIILATQRPSVNIVNGTIKANFPARISCRVASHIDSRVILDSNGAETLYGKGDALIRDNTRNLARFQIAYTDANEVCKNFGK